MTISIRYELVTGAGVPKQDVADNLQGQLEVTRQAQDLGFDARIVDDEDGFYLLIERIAGDHPLEDAWRLASRLENAHLRFLSFYSDDAEDFEKEKHIQKWLDSMGVEIDEVEDASPSEPEMAIYRMPLPPHGHWGDTDSVYAHSLGYMLLARAAARRGLDARYDGEEVVFAGELGTLKKALADVVLEVVEYPHVREKDTLVWRESGWDIERCSTGELEQTLSHYNSPVLVDGQRLPIDFAS